MLEKLPLEELMKLQVSNMIVATVTRKAKIQGGGEASIREEDKLINNINTERDGILIPVDGKNQETLSSYQSKFPNGKVDFPRDAVQLRLIELQEKAIANGYKQNPNAPQKPTSTKGTGGGNVVVPPKIDNNNPFKRK